MSDGVSPLDLLGKEAQRLTGEQSTTEHAQAPEKPQKQGGIPWERLQTFKQLLEDSGAEIPSNMTFNIVEQVSMYAMGQIAGWYSEYTKQKERCKELRAELQMMRKQYGDLPREKKQGGRKRKVIDWAQYDLLKQAGMSEQDIAQYMHIGASTLRRYKAER